MRIGLFFLILSFVGTASADPRETGSGCAYAGNLSKYVHYSSVNRSYCQAVEKLTIKDETYSCENGKHDQVICNPYLSGVADGKAICVPRSQRSFIQCPRDPKKAREFIDKNGLQREALSHLASLNDRVCGDSEKRAIYGFACNVFARYRRAFASEKTPAVAPKAQAQKPTAAQKKLEADCNGKCDKPKTPVALEKPADDSRNDIKKVLRAACAPLPNTEAPGVLRIIASEIMYPTQIESKAPALIAQAAPSVEAERSNKAGCPAPGCSRVNQAEPTLLVEPAETQASPNCPETAKTIEFPSAEVDRLESGTRFDGQALNRSFRGGSKEDCEKQLADWTKQTILHSSALGKFMHENLCPNECSYSTQMKTQDKGAGNGACDLEARFTIQCGPPRKTLSFKYNVKVAVKNDWSCKAN